LYIALIYILTNSMCYYILLKKALGQGQKQEVQDPYTLSQINLT
jgi:hypothetical protein